jgi:4-amino-4-deoxy-L-arabinose transferase-like glycosyltransferase
MREVRGLVIVAAGLLTAWSFVVPIFEGPDEFLHWQYARHLHDERRLPIYGPEFAEGNSPPLYYAAIAPVATRTVTPPPAVWLDGRGLFAMPFLPRFFLGAADDWQRYWPIRNARLVTVLMSLVTVVVCARIGFEATDRASTALLTAAIVAFLPQFTFRGSQVSNDALVTTMAACAVWGMVRIVRRGFTWRRGVLTAVALAAAWLTKINALCLVPAFALVILTEPVSWRQRFVYLSVFGVTLSLVAPWSIRNVMLYGDAFALSAMPSAVPLLVVERAFVSDYWVTRFPREVFKTFVGYFGHATVKLPRLVYVAWLLFFAVAAAGLARRGRRGQQGHQGQQGRQSQQGQQGAMSMRLAAILLTAIAGAVVILVRINLQFDQPQGRYLFPALPAIALMMAIGLESWRVPARPAALALAAVNVLILAFVVIPAYPPNVAVMSEAIADVHADHAVGGDWIANMRIEAHDARFVIFDIAGSPSSNSHDAREIHGEAIVTVDARDITLPFSWLNDGQRRTIYLTLVPHASAGVAVTGIRIRPGGDGAIQKLRVAGSIPSHDF